MDGIPPALDTDVEDVVWALQTADALWKRSERADALVWLRRAAQAAGDANDDNRALALARGAAELTERMARESAASLGSAPPAEVRGPSGIEDLLRASTADANEVAEGHAGVLPPPLPQVPLPAVVHEEIAEEVEIEPPSLPPHPAADASDRSDPVEVVAVSVAPTSQRVLTAAESHAGMLDPWAEPEPTGKPSRSPPLARPPQKSFNDDEVVTSAKPVKARPPSPGPPPLPRRSAPRPPPTAPPEARPASPFTPDEGVTLKRAQAPIVEAPLAAKPQVKPKPPDLSAVEALGDLPDDARASFALAADVRTLVRGETVPSFALVFIVEGLVQVIAAGGQAAAASLATGAVLRSRGTLETTIPLRLVCSSDAATAATWDDADVEAVLGPCPWVEEDLRAAGDRIQALVALSIGPLGQPSYDQVRALLATRLEVRALASEDAYLRETDAIPGLMIVAGGALELVGSQGVTAVLKPGAFVFPSETLSLGKAPLTARAGKGGALVVHADRSTTQELLVTQPLLLELLSSQ
jgi:hypothetical protein